MSKKVLKLAGQRPMLLAFLVMATLTLGLLFSGWFTPMPTRAQQGSGNQSPNDEATNCVVASVTNNCLASGSVSLIAPTNSPIVRLGLPVSVTAGLLTTTGQVVTITTYSNCPTISVTNPTTPSYVVTWTATVGDFSASGTGLTANFTPTDCGSGAVDFTLNYTNNSPCGGTGTSGVSGGFSVVSLNIDGGGKHVSSANGNDLAMVGQHINLTASTCGGTFSNYQWSVAGYAISNYVVNPATLTTYFPVTNSSVSFYWVDGGAKGVSCLATCGGVVCSTNIIITVSRPTATMYSKSAPVFYAYSTLLSHITLSLGDKTTGANDLNYDVAIDSPIHGDAEFVQMINALIYSGQTPVSNEADNLVPYDDSIHIYPGGLPGNPGQAFHVLLPLSDTPANSGWMSVTMQAHFTDYMMYKPRLAGTIFAPLGTDSIFVPLGTVEWGLDAGAYYGWPIQIAPQTVFGPFDPSDSTGFPIWTVIYQNP